MFITHSAFSLPSVSRYRGMTYDGRYFYLSKGGVRRIDRFGPDFRPEGGFDTCRIYTCLCFDPKEACFWASSDQSPATLYKLNADFQEIDSLPLSVADVNGELGMVTGLSYDGVREHLIVGFARVLIRVDTRRPEKNALLVCERQGWILGVLSISPYLLCHRLVDGDRMVSVYSLGGSSRKDYPVSGDGLIETAVFIPSLEGEGRVRLMVLLSKRGRYSYVLDGVLPCKGMPPIDGANFWVCGGRTRRPDPPPDRPDTGGLLESVALLERAVSQVLSAEGDRLQNMLAASPDAAIITEAGRTVQATLAQATQLEQAMYDLLSLCQTADGGQERFFPVHRRAEPFPEA